MARRVIDSWGALELPSVPKRLGVIGAGVIGLELGSVWRRLGSEVVVLEALDAFLPMADGAVAKKRSSITRSSASTFAFGAKVSGAEKSGNGLKLKYADAKGERNVEVDRVIVAIGRRLTRKICWARARACKSMNAVSSTTIAVPMQRMCWRSAM